MLTEEALILLATLGASGLLALGVAELAWPAAPRRPTRRARVLPPPRFEAPPVVVPSVVVEAEPAPAVAEPPVIVEPVESVVAEAPVIDPPPAPVETPTIVPLPAAPRRVPGSSRSTRASRGDWRRSSIAPVEASVDAPIAELAPPIVSEPVAPLVEEPAPRPKVLPVDTCRGMYDDGRFAEVVSLGSAALEVHARMASVSERPHEAAALHDLVGLSRQQLGDREGARAAFVAAIRDAEPSVRSTYVDHLVALAGDVTAGGNDAPDAETNAVRVRELRAWVQALDDARASAPGDERLGAAQSAVRDALSPACERLVARVVSGEGDVAARTLVLDALADEAMPAAWRERLREQLAAASSAEIGQLTAQAIRSVQDGKDGEALEALERAERLAAALPPGAVADERREEFERRLWWGYTKVGLRRCEIGNFDGAVEPLFHALHLGGIDEERLGETRAALVRAIEGAVEARWPEIQQLGLADRGAAQSEIAKLGALLRSATDRGLTEEDLGDAFAKVSQLAQALSEAS